LILLIEAGRIPIDLVLFYNKNKYGGSIKMRSGANAWI
jgi:hypothetical protein